MAAESWGNYLKRDRSVIVDLFQGQLKSTVTCTECGCQSSKFEAFMYLSLPVPPPSKDGKSLTLDDCLREFTKEEQLDPENMWRCPRCKDFRQASKRFELWKMPPLLLVHLKRFCSNGRGQHVKRAQAIITPLHGLDLSAYTGGSLGVTSAATYSLYATCNTTMAPCTEATTLHTAAALGLVAAKGTRRTAASGTHWTTVGAER